MTADRFRSVLSIDRVLIGIVVAVWAGLYLHGLGEHPLRVWDESRYAIPAMHMLEGGGWLEPRIRVNTHGSDLGLTPRLVKPPLSYWLQATSMSAFGVTTFAARLPSALAVLGSAGLVFHLGERTYDRRAGFAAALVLLIFPGMLLGSHGGRAAVTDPTLTLFGSLFVWLTWRGRERPRLLVPAGLFAGLAVMTKGVAAGVFVFVLAPVLLRYYRSYLTPWTGAAVAVTTVVALPWHLYVWLRHGDAFLEQYFYTAVASRSQGEMTGPPAEPIFEFMNYPYFRFALELFAPPYPHALPAFGLGIVAALGLVGWFLRRDGRDHLEKVFFVWWVAAVPLTFAVAGGNHAWYLMPLYVPGAVLVGYVPAAIADGTVGEALRSGSRSGRARSSPTQTDAASRSLRTRILAIPATLGSVLERGDSGGDSSAATTVAYAAVCVVVALLLVASYAPPPTEAHDVEQRTIGEAVAAEVPEGATIYVWSATGDLEDGAGEDGEPEGGVVDRRALMTLSFYADRPLERATPESIQSDPDVEYAVVPLEEVNGLERDHRVVVEGPVNGVAVVAFSE